MDFFYGSSYSLDLTDALVWLTDLFSGVSSVRIKSHYCQWIGIEKSKSLLQLSSTSSGISSANNHLLTPDFTLINIHNWKSWLRPSFVNYACLEQVLLECRNQILPTPTHEYANLQVYKCPLVWLHQTIFITYIICFDTQHKFGHLQWKLCY